MKITIHLPVTPYIKKFLTVRLGKEYHLSLDDWFGGMIINMLENKTNKNYSISESKKDKKTEHFSFTASLSLSSKNGFFIEERHEHLINKIVDALFREDLYINAIINKREYDIDYNTSINNVLDAYDITEEDLSVDALKRDLNRKRDKFESMLFLS